VGGGRKIDRMQRHNKLKARKLLEESSRREKQRTGRGVLRVTFQDKNLTVVASDEESKTKMVKSDGGVWVGFGGTR